MRSTIFLPIMIAVIVIGAAVRRFFAGGQIDNIMIFQFAAFIGLEMLSIFLIIRMFKKYVEAY